MAVLIDSSILIAAERSGGSLAAYIGGRQDEPAYLSVISASELLHGVHRATDVRVRARRLAFVEAALGGLAIIEVDLQTARLHAQIWADLAQNGQMIGLHDSWLAATALAHGLEIVTANIREFRRVPGLRLAEWR